MSQLDSLSVFNEIKNALGKGCLKITGCVPSQMEHLIYELGSDFASKVIITFDEQKALDIYVNYSAFDSKCVYYPAKDPIFDKANIRGNYLTEQRIEIVKKLYNKEKLCVVTTIEAFSEKLSSVKEISNKLITIKQGDSISEEDIAKRLVDLGYENESIVQSHGEFSIRGNIIDIFPFTEDAPFRIDLFGDDVETIKVFDVQSQRSIENVEEVNIFPGAESSGACTAGFLDYFNEDTLFIFDEPAKIFSSSIYSEEFLNDVKKYQCIGFSMLDTSCDELEFSESFFVNARNIPSYSGRFNDLAADLKKYKEENWDVSIYTSNSVRAERLKKELKEQGVSTCVKVGAVRVGFEYPDIKLSFISEVDIFGKEKKARKRRKRFSGDPIKDFTDLNIGDYVVHEQHGVGIYQGIVRIQSDGVEKDYMKIDYANNANLYVLATQFDKIQKYSSSESTKPKIHKLGGKEWVNTKQKVRTAVKDIAKDLVKLYAERQSRPGYKYLPDTTWQKQFEDEFEYVETDDQLRAIEEVKADMESSKIMDRLICGDVGFGKTEVAIRAAFKAVQEGKQVAFLVPTTILARQHYDTIRNRVKNYPITVSQLSRFATPSEQKKTIEELRNGMMDIVVGTHRLLSKDVKFKDLGLLIIDEEQRFGVTHKEKIKQLKNNVDVITLSATPIPRTLNMSLTGIRDMSLLTEPPLERVPIQTYVMEYSKEAIKEAIVREHRRGGQVYYVYNRTNNIDLVADEIRKMVPDLSVEFAHGQMRAKELEQIMEDFIAGDIDVLISTTIIETGMDIPNVNTIIVHDADRFGLSQLYQLRGRVGRANKTAYAFLMYRKDKLLQEVAEKRLKAIREFSDLGSGIKIAMRDLEIRGAGNVLGAEQSGHMEAVGYELYCKMLSEAVALLKGEEVLEDYETTIDLNIDGYIPAEYIKNEFEKLNMYKKISTISNEEEQEDIRNELIDRFGEIPSVTENLLEVALIKAKAHSVYITEISGGKREFKIGMFAKAPIDTYKIHGFLNENKDSLHFVAGSTPYFVFKPKEIPKTVEEIQKTLLEFFGKLKNILE